MDGNVVTVALREGDVEQKVGVEIDAKILGDLDSVVSSEKMLTCSKHT